MAWVAVDYDGAEWIYRMQPLEERLVSKQTLNA